MSWSGLPAANVRGCQTLLFLRASTRHPFLASAAVHQSFQSRAVLCNNVSGLWGDLCLGLVTLPHYLAFPSPSKKCKSNAREKSRAPPRTCSCRCVGACGKGGGRLDPLA